jgi:hypothetical protein
MAVVEVQTDRVIAHRFDTVDIHIFLANLQHPLTRTMALHLRGGREHPQVLTGQIVVGTIVEGYFQYAGLAV